MSGREIEVVTRSLGQPALDEVGFVGGVVVEDQMDLEINWDGLVDEVEKLPELLSLPKTSLGRHGDLHKDRPGHDGKSTSSPRRRPNLRQHRFSLWVKRWTPTSTVGTIPVDRTAAMGFGDHAY
jgi:hypothetical protein